MAQADSMYSKSILINQSLMSLYLSLKEDKTTKENHYFSSVKR